MPDTLHPGQMVELLKPLHSTPTHTLYPVGFHCRIYRIHAGGQVCDVQMLDPDTDAVLEITVIGITSFRPLS